MATEATMFPQALALAGTFDPVLVREVSAQIAREVRARGIPLVLLNARISARTTRRWLRYPDDYNTKHSAWDYEHFVFWIDEDIKKETKAAMKSGESFGPAILTFDQYNQYKTETE